VASLGVKYLWHSFTNPLPWINKTTKDDEKIVGFEDASAFYKYILIITCNFNFLLEPNVT